MAIFTLISLAQRSFGQGSFRYELVDLADTRVGEDLWQYRYFLSGFNFQTNEGFSVFFDYRVCADLKDAQPAGNATWSLLAVQPDVLLQADGYLDGLALVNGPGYGGPFAVTFTWKGQGSPGEQTFYTYNSNFAPTFSGTTSTVPEPGSVWLSGLGLLIFLGWKVRPKARVMA